jgi:DNA-binding CsgD family transcriptional regulator
VANRCFIDCELPNKLSERERQILSLIAAGRDDAEIAETLSISRNTVQSPRREYEIEE